MPVIASQGIACHEVQSTVNVRSRVAELALHCGRDRVESAEGALLPKTGAGVFKTGNLGCSPSRVLATSFVKHRVPTPETTEITPQYVYSSSGPLAVRACATLGNSTSQPTARRDVTKSTAPAVAPLSAFAATAFHMSPSACNVGYRIPQAFKILIVA
jgi:hypothetical protein